MLDSKTRIKTYLKGFREAIVGSGAVGRSSAKYDDVMVEYVKDVRFIPPTKIRSNRDFDASISAIDMEQRKTQRDKCRYKYSADIIERLLDIICAPLEWCRWCKRFNNINVAIVFYAQTKDMAIMSVLNSLKSIFECKKYVVHIERTERGWHRYIEQNSPVVVHCFSKVDINPVVNENVVMAVFDFEGSYDIARAACSFCKVSLGYKRNDFIRNNSKKFFELFYGSIVEGNKIIATYESLSERLDFSPCLSRGALPSGMDLKIFGTNKLNYQPQKGI